jgi:2-dehydro-3-deoxyphosphogluconate aldolase/(4S)-4-hydroxy-2-oxoglutarate aldolase
MAGQAQRATEHIKQSGLIAILRGEFSVKYMLEIGEALHSAAVTVMEVTLNSSNALDAITQLRGQLGERMLIGAGTVRTASQVEAALAAGAQFIVAPNFDPDSVACSHVNGVLHLPGVFTASEAQAAFAAGCRLVKLFPAELLGPAYLKALRAPLNDIEFVPTGGMTVNTIPEYVRAGAVAVGVGSALISDSRLTPAEIHSRAARLRAAWDEAKLG